MKIVNALVLLSFVWLSCFSGEAKKTDAELIYEKAVAESTKEASKAYGTYLKALDAAKAKVLKSLESAKSDLNDPKKGTLNIQDRAAAIAEIDKKIQEINEGALGDAIIAQNKPQDQGDGASTIRILSATFGARNVSIDVTKEVKEIFSSATERFQLNDKILGDPLPGERKTLTIIYMSKGKKKSATFQSWDYIDPSLL